MRRVATGLLFLALAGALLASAGAIAAQSDDGVVGTPAPRPEAAAGGGTTKPLWPLDAIDVALLFVVVGCLSLAGGAGIGGGAILVPVFLLLRGWPTPTAVALSNVTILGGSFANFVCNVRRRRANGARTIDWELILMMEPPTIIGAIFGAMLNKILPNYLTTYLLAIMLTLMTLRLFTKAREAYQKESKLLKDAKAAAKAAHHAAARADGADGQQQQQQQGRAKPRSAAAPAGSDIDGGPDQSGGAPAPARAPSLARRSSVIERSFSRLRSSRLMASDVLYAPAPGGEDAGGAAAAAAEAGGVEDVSRQLLDLGDCLTLCQGDGMGDGLEPIVAVPDAYTSSDDASEGEGGGAGNEEAAGGLDDLAQPLLQPRTGSVLRSASVTGKAVLVRQRSIPLPHFATLVALSAWVVGADIAQHWFACGSWQYWLVSLSVLAPAAAIVLAFRQVLLRKYHHDELAPGAQHAEGELSWTATTTLTYPSICSLAGLIAGLFGIGGGVVKGPLMLELGVPADVAAATSATMIMFTAGSACVVYSRFGSIQTDYAAVLIALGFTVTLFSQLLTFWLIKLLGRRSIIVFMMVVLMGVACSIMYLQSFLESAKLIRHPELLTQFGSLCPAAANSLARLFGSLLAALAA